LVTKTFNKMYCYGQCNRFYTLFDQQIAQSLINDHLSPVVILHVRPIEGDRHGCIYKVIQVQQILSKMWVCGV